MLSLSFQRQREMTQSSAPELTSMPLRLVAVALKMQSSILMRSASRSISSSVKVKLRMVTSGSAMVVKVGPAMPWWTPYAINGLCLHWRRMSRR